MDQEFKIHYQNIINNSGTDSYYDLNDNSFTKEKTKILENSANKNQCLVQTCKILKENIFTLVGTLLYLFSLKGCYASQDECVLQLENKFYVSFLAISLILSSILYLLNLIFIFKQKIRCYTLPVQILVITFLIVFYDTGTNLQSHGGYNRVLFLILFLIFTSIYFISLLILSYYKSNKLATIITCLLIPLFLYFGFVYKVQNSCSGWEKGFKSSSIDNTTPCIITTPSICYEKLFDGVFDVSFYLRDTCDTIGNNKREAILKYNKSLNREVKRIGYPKIEDWNFKTKSLYDKFKREVVRSIVDMDDPNIKEEDKSKIEVTVDFGEDDKGKMYINVKKLDIISDTRKIIFKAMGKEVLAKNVFILFIDSVSRNHFQRKLPKLWKWIEQFYNPDENSEYESFQFTKFHGVASWTNGNLMPAFFGVPFDEKIGGTYVIKHYKDNGFMLGSFTNQCSREFVDLHGGSMTNALTWQKYDHELSAPFCDPNFTSPDNQFPLLNGPYGIRKKCLYSKPTLEHAIDYTTQFMNLYKDQPKFFRLGDINGHEGTGEVVKYDDDLLTEFMEKFQSEGFMDDTVTIILTDHGYTMPGIHTILNTEDHNKEVTLPFLSFVLPKNMKNFEEIKQNLKANENRAITPYDLHNTLIGILSDKSISYNSKGEDLFQKKVERSTTCKHFNIKSDWCRCSEEI